jgi:AcrR family transcriptional regulator
VSGRVRRDHAGTVRRDDETAADDSAATPRPLRKDAARNRELLIAAARDVFAKRGLEASLDDIAHQAGVGVGTAYRHFGDKYELAEAIMGEAIGEVVAATEHALQVDDPWQGLVGFLEAVLEIQTKDRGLREVMMGVHNPHKSDEVYEQLSQPILAILERAQQAGSARSDATGSDLGCIITMLCEVSDLAGDTAPELWRRYLGIFLAALRPGGPELPGAPLGEDEFRAASERHNALRSRRTNS